MKREEVKYFTIARWTKITFYGWLLGVVFILILSSMLDGMDIEHMQFYLGVCMGAGVGITQWILLNKYISISKNWIWLSIGGMGIPFIIFDLLTTSSITYKIPLSISLGAITVGILQFLLLKKHSHHANWWIVGCFIGWTFGVLTVFTVDYTRHLALHNLVLAFINLLLILAGGVVLGVVTGSTLKKILN